MFSIAACSDKDISLTHNLDVLSTLNHVMHFIQSVGPVSEHVLHFSKHFWQVPFLLI